MDSPQTPGPAPVSLTPADRVNFVRVSPHFLLMEFEDRLSHQVMLDPDLLKRLEALREKVGAGIVVTSGYRTPEHNAQVGGAEDSQHMVGRAADIVVTGLSPQLLRPLAEVVGFTGVGVYSDHLHVDVRPGPLVIWYG